MEKETQKNPLETFHMFESIFESGLPDQWALEYIAGLSRPYAKRLIRQRNKYLTERAIFTNKLANLEQNGVQ